MHWWTYCSEMKIFFDKIDNTANFLGLSHFLGISNVDKNWCEWCLNYMHWQIYFKYEIHVLKKSTLKNSPDVFRNSKLLIFLKQRIFDLLIACWYQDPKLFYNTKSKRLYFSIMMSCLYISKANNSYDYHFHNGCPVITKWGDYSTFYIFTVAEYLSPILW